MEIKFKKLTPTIVEDMKSYQEALDYVFSEDDVVNVALTGIYGAGKSSVWKTYEESKEENFCIHISLASFFEDDNNNQENLNSNGGKTIGNSQTGEALQSGGTNQSIEAGEGKKIKAEDKKRIEGHIINQLIHQIDKENIPYTRFKIKNTPGKELKKVRNSIVLSILLGLAISFRKDILDFIQRTFVNIKIDYVIGFSIIVIIISICYIISTILKYQLKNPIIKKISYKNNQIDLFDEKEDSILDKNLDEIIYILQNSGVKAIVFEDLDRYNDISIFSKLREINFLVNKKLKKESSEDGSNIKFIYLIKDDMFRSKDRTKFFDFIMPIVPSIDINNSKEIMLEAFEDDIRENQLDQENKSLDKIFIERLSYYIDDRRLLINIYNEYSIYKNQIDADERGLDLNKLLAIVVYKNIFPKDFAELQINKGYVNHIFKKKHDFIDKKSNKLLEDISKKEDDIKKLEISIEESEAELMAIFMGGNKAFFNQATNRDVAKEILNNNKTNITYAYLYSDTASSWENESKIGILRNLNDNDEFVERKKRLGNETKSKRIEILKNDIKTKNEEITSLNSKMLSEIIEDMEDVFNISGYEDILNDHYFGIIKFLISDGRLDELYFEYMGYFYPNSLKNQDKKFQRGVFEGEKKAYDYPLDNSMEVLRGFNESDFLKIGILNYDLLDSIIESENFKYLKIMIKTILKADKIDFISGYLKERQSFFQAEFIIFCNKEFSDILSIILSDDRISDGVRNLYIRITLIKSQEYFESINKDNILVNYLECNEYIFENISNNKENILINGLNKLGVKIDKLSNLIGDLSENIINGVAKYQLYNLKIDNIKFIIKKLRPEYNNEEIIEQNYSIINENENLRDILDYVNNNIEIYVSELNRYLSNKYIKYKNNIKDTITLLNSKVDIEEKIEFIKNNDTSIDYLDTIKNPKLWNTLIETDNLELKYFNILIYLDNYNEIPDELYIYIALFKEIDIKNTIDDKVIHFGNRERSEEILLSCRDMDDNIYKIICEVSNFIFNKFDLDNLQEEKRKSLINNNKIEFNLENFIYIYNNYYDNIDMFIDSNYDEYVQNIEVFEKSNFKLDHDLILDILKSKIISEERKLKILDYYDGELSLDEIINLPDNIVKKFIVDFDLSRDDLQVLIDKYDDIKCKDIIIKKIIDNAELVQFNNAKKKFIIDILSNDNNSEELKLKVISETIDRYSADDIREFFRVGELSDYESLFQGKKPKIAINNYSHKILSELGEKEIISSVSNQDNEYYRVYSRRK